MYFRFGLYFSVRLVPGGAPTPVVWRGGRAMYFRFGLYFSVRLVPGGAPTPGGMAWRPRHVLLGSVCTFRFGFVAGGAPTPVVWRGGRAMYFILLQHFAQLFRELVAAEWFGEELDVFFEYSSVGDDVGGVA